MKLLFMTYMQFKIPQNIDVEDKIIPPFLTIKQLFILLGGGAIDYIIYIVSFERYDFSIYIIPVMLVAIVTVMIAFFKMENITFIKLILLVFETLINPRTRFWFHYPELISPLDEYEAIIVANTEVEKEKKEEEQKGIIKNLEELTSFVDSSKKMVNLEQPSHQDEK